MASPELTEAYEWQGRTIVGSDGEKIGTVDEVYLDERSDKPEWVTVKTREPITDANRGQATDGPAISEEEHEVVLHED